MDDAAVFSALFDIWTVHKMTADGEPLPLGKIDQYPDDILGALVASGFLDVTLSQRGAQLVAHMIKNTEETEMLLKSAPALPGADVDRAIDMALGLDT